jgi:hypothetical protein
MAIISACKSWILKVGKSLFYLAFCQDISVNFIFTVVFKVDTWNPHTGHAFLQPLIFQPVR